MTSNVNCLHFTLLCSLLLIWSIKFAVVFTFGNILAWEHNLHYGAPEQQLRTMFDPVRLYATAIYVGCAVLALILALWVRYI
ncbi:hypothetical protein PAHAL_5G523200 [Panicum hallii]|uniref:Vesicle transport protein n=1 Tax=Panicum hallii TaxID=206008 RepID=A0A2S3HZ18_9POAL|nr:hypothetical protein PAHAL_5G523200 [Panicum hallii]